MTSNTIEATAINNDHDDLFAPILPCREVLDHTLSLFHPDGKRLTVEAVENVARTLASMIISSDDETRKPLNVAWKETAASVLKWTNEDSMLFFDFFQLFQSTLSSDNNNNNNNNIIQTTDMQEKASEALAKFTVFLFAQLYQHTDGANRRGRMLMAQERASPEKSNDEINNRNSSKGNMASPPKTKRYLETPTSLLSPSSAKTLAKQTHLDDSVEQTKFLKDHLAQIIGILRDCLPPLAVIDKGQASALEMILNTNDRAGLTQALPMFRTTNVIKADSLITHLKTRLKPYSNDSFSSPSPPQNQSSKTDINAPTVTSSLTNATNVSLYGVQRSTKIHVRESEDGDDNDGSLPDLHIAHNEKCSIYVLQPFRFGTISGCTDCTIVVGAVEAVLSLERCERVTLIASCKQLRISNSFDCTFHLFTPCRPLLLGDNRSLIFAPYNTTYNPLIQHLKQARLIQSGSNNNSSTVVSNASSLPIEWPENLWNKPHDLDIDQDGDDAYKLMEPEYFFPFAVPINDVVDDTMDTSNSNKSKRKRNKNIMGPVPLPKEFQDAIVKKSSNVDELRELIKAPLPNINQEENSSPNANNSENMNIVAENELEAAVQEKFREWLVSSGQIREVADLIGLERQK